MASKSFKIGIYGRVSTEEQAENPEGSIKNQQQRLRDYVKFKNGDGAFGEIVDTFIDAGISAKDMNRPQLKRLLAMIEAKEIDLVLVTDLSRFTRSTKDFSYLWDFMHEHGCKFQSLRENFDSTTAAGEMIMFTLANFAQFERRQTAERISTAFVARAKRGLYNGGSVPLGYKIVKDQPGRLEVFEDEAIVVRQIFSLFLDVGTLAATAQTLNRKGVKISRHREGGGGSRAGFFKIDTVYRILINKSYIGKRTFTEKGELKTVDASWPGIVDEDIFNRVQKILKKNKSAKKPHSKERYPYLLSGFTFCKHCGHRMAGKSAHGKCGKVAYYEHSWATKANSELSKKVFQCDPHRLLAKKIEPAVWEAVKDFICDPEIAKSMIKSARKRQSDNGPGKEMRRLKQKLLGTKSQIEALAERLSVLPKGLDPKPIFDQMTRLQELKAELEGKITDVQSNSVEHDEPISLESLETFTQGLRALLVNEEDPVVKAAVISKVVERILVTKEGIEIYFHLGTLHYKRELKQLSSRSFFRSKNGVGERATVLQFKTKEKGPLSRARRRTDYFLKDCGSNSLTFGGGGGNRTPVRK